MTNRRPAFHSHQGPGTKAGSTCVWGKEKLRSEVLSGEAVNEEARSLAWDPLPGSGVPSRWQAASGTRGPREEMNNPCHQAPSHSAHRCLRELFC